MNALELAERILADIEAGTLDPNAVVIRPFCMCDQDLGYVEAAFLDQVIRRHDPAHLVSGQRIYRYGNVEPSGDTTVTLKLG
jgi:hypothetical protein